MAVSWVAAVTVTEASGAEVSAEEALAAEEASEAAQVAAEAQAADFKKVKLEVKNSKQN